MAAILMALLFFINMYKIETGTDTKQVVSMNVTTITVIQSDNTMPVQPVFQLFPFTLNLVLFILIIITIFWYKNRIQQNLLTKLSILLCSGLLVLMLLSTDKLKNFIMETTYTASYQPGIFIPVISIALLFLASKSIMKDEALVRSAERLR
jgi:hypothetical protein